MSNVKNGKFVYKNEDSMKKMHEFYDKTLVSLDVPCSFLLLRGIRRWFKVPYFWSRQE